MPLGGALKVKGKKMKKDCLFVLKVMAVIVLIVVGLGESGHAAAPKSYSIDMQYNAAQAVIPEHLKPAGKARGVIISVAEFTDARRVNDKKIIGWVKELDGSKVPLFPKNVIPVRAVTNGIKEYLKKAGYTVADKIVQWDLKEGTMPKGIGKVIISGSIDELEVTCWTGVFSNDYKADVKLSIVVADSAKGKILYKSNVAIASSKTDVSFSEGQLGGQASIALSDAIEKIFEGKTIAQKIREAIIP
jgi:hypothetical protein